MPVNYGKTSIIFMLLIFLDGYRYSIKNCLYEGVLQKIISQCKCLPSYVELNLHNLSICKGEKLGVNFIYILDTSVSKR